MVADTISTRLGVATVGMELELETRSGFDGMIEADVECNEVTASKRVGEDVEYNKNNEGDRLVAEYCSI
jgi:hypothetical protein